MKLKVNRTDIEEAIAANENQYLHAKNVLERVFNVDPHGLPGWWLTFYLLFNMSK